MEVVSGFRGFNRSAEAPVPSAKSGRDSVSHEYAPPQGPIAERVRVVAGGIPRHSAPTRRGSPLSAELKLGSGDQASASAPRAASASPHLFIPRVGSPLSSVVDVSTVPVYVSTTVVALRTVSPEMAARLGKAAPPSYTDERVVVSKEFVHDSTGLRTEPNPSWVLSASTNQF